MDWKICCFPVVPGEWGDGVTLAVGEVTLARQPAFGEAFACCLDESINCNLPAYEEFMSFRISRIRFLIPPGAWMEISLVSSRA